MTRGPVERGKKKKDERPEGVERDRAIIVITGAAIKVRKKGRVT